MEIEFLGIKIVLTLPWRSLGMLLLLLGIVTVSYILMTRMRKERILKFANFYTLKRVHGYKSIVPSPFLLIIKLITVTLLFLVATESIQVSIVRPVANTDFCIAIDVSQTMLLPDYEPNRIEFAKKTILDWVENLPGASKLCVIKFSERAIPLTSLTLNIFEIKNKINSLKVESNSSGTAIGEAIFVGASILSDSDKQRFLVIITDGENNAGRNLTLALKEAKKKKIVIYTIGIGVTNETKQLIEELEKVAKKKGIKFSFPKLDDKSLRKISEETGGKFFFVTNETAFEESMKNIVVKNERIPLNSDYYVLLFISILIALELLIFSRFGAV